jgi:hypothetical protein
MNPASHHTADEALLNANAVHVNVTILLLKYAETPIALPLFITPAA